MNNKDMYDHKDASTAGVFVDVGMPIGKISDLPSCCMGPCFFNRLIFDQVCISQIKIQEHVVVLPSQVPPLTPLDLKLPSANLANLR